MRFFVTTSVDSLFCVQPDDDASDETYAWIFTSVLDGTTIFPSSTSNDGLRCTAVVTTAAGSQGVLPDPDVDGGESVAVPAGMGSRTTELVPVALQAAGQSIHLHGILLTVVMLFDEDQSDNGYMEAAHVFAGAELQKQIRAFIDDISIGQVLTDIGKWLIDNVDTANPPQPLSQRRALAGEAVLKQRIDDFSASVTKNLSDKIKDVIKGQVDHQYLDSLIILANGGQFPGLPAPVVAAFGLLKLAGAVVQSIDSDDTLGVDVITTSAPPLLASGFASAFIDDVSAPRRDDIPNFSSNEAHYQVRGVQSLNVLSQGDMAYALRQLPSLHRPPRHSYTFLRDHRCVKSGQKVEWWLSEITSEAEWVVLLPPALYRGARFVWSVNGHRLVVPASRQPYAGSVQLTVPAELPRFDEDARMLVMYDSVPTNVTLFWAYDTTADDQERMVLKSSSNNGCWSCQVSVVLESAFANNNAPSVPIGLWNPRFEGQSIGIANTFMGRYVACLIDGADRGRSGARRITKKDLWGPYGQGVWQERLGRVAEQSPAAGAQLRREMLRVLREVARGH